MTDDYLLQLAMQTEYRIDVVFEHGGVIIESLFGNDEADAIKQFDAMFMRFISTGRLHAGGDALEVIGVANLEYVGVERLELFDETGALVASLKVSA